MNAFPFTYRWYGIFCTVFWKICNFLILHDFLKLWDISHYHIYHMSPVFFARLFFADFKELSIKIYQYLFSVLFFNACYTNAVTTFPPCNANPSCRATYCNTFNQRKAVNLMPVVVGKVDIESWNLAYALSIEGPAELFSKFLNNNKITLSSKSCIHNRCKVFMSSWK